jgi:ribose 5-phosphate isomerase B
MLALGADVTDGATAEESLALFLAAQALGHRYAARRERLARLDVSEV